MRDPYFVDDRHDFDVCYTAMVLDQFVGRSVGESENAYVGLAWDFIRLGFPSWLTIASALATPAGSPLNIPVTSQSLTSWVDQSITF